MKIALIPGGEMNSKAGRTDFPLVDQKARSHSAELKVARFGVIIVASNATFTPGFDPHVPRGTDNREATWGFSCVGFVRG